MKRLVLMLFLSLIGINYISAQLTCTDPDASSIPVDKGEWHPATRSVFAAAPDLYQNNHTIYIESSATLTNLQVTVTDLSGNILMDSYVNVTGGIEYTFSLSSGIEAGTYKIQLTYGTAYLYGYFDIK